MLREAGFRPALLDRAFHTFENHILGHTLQAQGFPLGVAPSVYVRRMDEYVFTSELWEHDGPAPWCFVSLPHDEADEIEARAGGHTAFGSVRVQVTVGATTWRTSLFPDTRQATYVLPMKQAVRAAEGLTPGDTCEVRLRIVDA